MSDDLSKYGREMTQNEAKPIPGYDDYVVTSDGRILSKERTAVRKNGWKQTYHAKEIKPLDNGNGYLSVMLYNNQGGKRFYVHRLVANAFIPNPDNLPQINHKDENKANNAAENLEWCSMRYNLDYGSHYKRITEKNSRPVIQYSLDGEYIAEYPSAMAAMRATGIKQGSISRVVKNGNNAGGYKWKLKQEVY